MERVEEVEEGGKRGVMSSHLSPPCWRRPQQGSRIKTPTWLSRFVDSGAKAWAPHSRCPSDRKDGAIEEHVEPQWSQSQNAEGHLKPTCIPEEAIPVSLLWGLD